jgi:hypothetical protein
MIWTWEEVWTLMLSCLMIMLQERSALSMLRSRLCLMSDCRSRSRESREFEVADSFGQLWWGILGSEFHSQVALEVSLVRRRSEG